MGSGDFPPRLRGAARPETLFFSALSVGLGAALLLFAFGSVNRYLNSDETQALHAAWMLKEGHVIYRDFWENHTPLTYLLLLPFFAVFPEDLTLVFAARGAAYLLFLAICFVTWRIAALADGRRAGILAVFLLVTFTLFTDRMIEARPDVPLVLLCLSGIWTLLGDPGRTSRGFWAGILLGFGFTATPKALFPATGLGLYFLLRFLAAARAARSPPPAAPARNPETGARDFEGDLQGPPTVRAALVQGLSFGSGFLAPILLMAALFVAAGAFRPFVRWVFHWNFGLAPEYRFAPFVLFPASCRPFAVAALAGFALLAVRMARGAPRGDARMVVPCAGVVGALLFLFLPEAAASLGGALAEGCIEGGSFAVLGLIALAAVFARSVSPRLLALLCAGAVSAHLFFFEMPRPWTQTAALFLPIAAVLGGALLRQAACVAFDASALFSRRLAAALLLAGILVPTLERFVEYLDDAGPLRRDRVLAEQIGTMERLLELAPPGAPVLDGVAAYVFRPNAYFFFKMTDILGRLHRDRIYPPRDIPDIPASLERSQCRVICLDSRLEDGLTPEARRFIEEHYLRVPATKPPIYVAGNRFRLEDYRGRRAPFEIRIPGRYRVVPGRAAGRVAVDGRPAAGGLELSRGLHLLTWDGEPEEILLRADLAGLEEE